MQLWRGRDPEKKMLTREGFAAMGGILGALDRHAESTFAQVAGDATRAVMLALTTAQGTRVHRTREAIVTEVGPIAERVLEVFEEARLVVHEPDGYALAHEALLTHWSRLRAWLSEAREDRVLAEELELDAARWSTTHDGTLLLRKRRLQNAGDLRRRTSLSEVADRFVAASRREARQGRIVLSVSALAVLTFCAIAGATYVRRIRAAEQVALQSAADAKRNEQVARDKEREAVLARDKIEEERKKTDSEKVKAKQAADKAQQALQDLTTAVAETKACKELLTRKAPVTKSGPKEICREVPGCPTCPPVCTQIVSTGKGAAASIE